MISPFVLLVGYILSIFLIFILTRQYYIKCLKDILEMCLALSNGNFNIRLRLDEKRCHKIALTLKEVSNRFNLQLQKVSEEKNKLEAILSSMTEGVIIVGSNSRIQHVSQNILHMLELRSQQWGDRPYWEIISHQEIVKAIKDALNTKKALRREIIDLNTPKTFFSMQISPVINQKDEIIAIIAVLHDVTELKHLELMRAEFVANVSHELKTPLTSIKGYVESLKDVFHNDPQSIDQFLETIIRQTNRLESLVHDLLDLSSLESSSLKLDITPQSLKKIIHSVLFIHENYINQLNHHVIVRIADDLPLILVDRLRIEQVFVNLIDNAIKFSPRSSTISISAKIENKSMRIDVQDTGLGISPDNISRIFERFYRVDKARSHKIDGTGLGLSIVYQIITAHQGKISVESTPGIGSIFSVHLPIVN